LVSQIEQPVCPGNNELNYGMQTSNCLSHSTLH